MTTDILQSFVKEIVQPKGTINLKDICWTPDDTPEEKAKKEIYFIENVMGLKLYEYQKELLRRYMKLSEKIIKEE